MASLKSPIVPELKPGTNGILKVIEIKPNHLLCCWILELPVVIK